MRSIISKSALATLLLAFFVGCVQPPTPPGSDIEVSDENNNTVTTQAIPTNGLKGDYYDNADFTGTLKTRYDATVNKSWNSSAPITGIQPTTYSVRWTGQIMPAFSQTYTFYVTSSDGARLMVNGQVLVNDWVDGAKRTKTGTVALQANTKYDIRLEYYRNATNAGSVKLEWQSSSRSKQVVPQASLFTTGTNLARAIDVTRPTLLGLGLDVDLSSARAILQGELLLTAVQSNDINSLIQARVSTTSQIISLTRYKYSGQDLKIDNLLTKQSVNILSFSSYFNPDKTLVQAKIDELVKLLAPVYLPIDISSAIGGRNLNVLRPLGYNYENPCPNCDAAKQNLLNQLRLVITGGGLTAIFASFPPSAPSGWWGIGAQNTVFYGLPSPFPSQEDYDKYISPAIKNWKDCVNLHCPATLIAEKSYPTQVQAPRNAQFSFEVSFFNKASVVPDLDYTATIQSDFTVVTFNILSGASGSVKPSGTSSIQVKGQCPNIDGIVTGTSLVTIKSNDPARPNVSISTPVTCGESPQIAVSPSSLSLVAAINSSTTGTLEIKNEGNAPLRVNNITSGETWLTPNISNILNAFAPSESRSVNISATCGSNAETRSATLQITSSDTSKPTTEVPVTLKCVSQLLNIISIDRIYNCSTNEGYALCAEGLMRDWSAINNATGFGQKYFNVTYEEALARARAYAITNYPYPGLTSGNWAYVGGCTSFIWWAYQGHAEDWYCMGI